MRSAFAGQFHCDATLDSGKFDADVRRQCERAVDRVASEREYVEAREAIESG